MNYLQGRNEFICQAEMNYVPGRNDLFEMMEWVICHVVLNYL